MKKIPTHISVFLLMILISIGVFGTNAFKGYRHYQLNYHGKITSGLVITKTDELHHERFVAYQFFDSAGHRMRSKVQVTPFAYDSAQLGGPISITYWPSDPTISEVTNGMNSFWILNLVSSGYLIISIVFVYFIVIRKVLKKQYLIKTGKLGSGKVMAAGTETSRMVYNFADPQGLSICGNLAISRADVPYWERNLQQNIAVYYNPKNPKENLAVMDRHLDNPHQISRTEAIMGPGMWGPIPLCLIWITVIVSVLLYQEMLGNYATEFFAYAFILLALVLITGLGVDSITISKQRARLLSGLRTTAQKVFVDLDPKPNPKIDRPNRLSYQYSDQVGALYDGWMSLTRGEAKRWAEKLNNQSANPEVYYNPADPAEHTLKS